MPEINTTYTIEYDKPSLSQQDMVWELEQRIIYLEHLLKVVVKRKTDKRINIVNNFEKEIPKVICRARLI